MDKFDSILTHPENLRVTINGTLWIQPAACVYGDYCGSGPLGVANVRWLKEHCKWEEFGGWDLERWAMDTSPKSYYHAGRWERKTKEEMEQEEKENAAEIDKVLAENQVMLGSGGYSSECAWIKCDSQEIFDLLEGLDNYPCFDDEIISEVEIEWEYEAWGSWLRSDLVSFLPENLQDEITDAMGSLYTDNLTDNDMDQRLFEAYRQAMEDTNTYPTPENSGVHVDTDRIKDRFIELMTEDKK